MEEMATTIMLRKPRSKPRQTPKPPGRTVVMLHPPDMGRTMPPPSPKSTRAEKKPVALQRTRMAGASPAVGKPPPPPPRKPPGPPARKPPAPPPLLTVPELANKKAGGSVPLRTIWMASFAIVVIAAIVFIPALLSSTRTEPSPAHKPVEEESRGAEVSPSKAEPAREIDRSPSTPEEAARLLLSGRRLAALAKYRRLAEAPEAPEAMAAMVIVLEGELNR